MCSLPGMLTFADIEHRKRIKSMELAAVQETSPATTDKIVGSEDISDHVADTRIGEQKLNCEEPNPECSLVRGENAVIIPHEQLPVESSVFENVISPIDASFEQLSLATDREDYVSGTYRVPHLYAYMSRPGHSCRNVHFKVKLVRLCDQWIHGIMTSVGAPLLTQNVKAPIDLYITANTNANPANITASTVNDTTANTANITANTANITASTVNDTTANTANITASTVNDTTANTASTTSAASTNTTTTDSTTAISSACATGHKLSANQNGIFLHHIPAPIWESEGERFISMPIVRRLWIHDELRVVKDCRRAILQTAQCVFPRSATFCIGTLSVHVNIIMTCFRGGVMVFIVQNPDTGVYFDACQLFKDYMHLLYWTGSIDTGMPVGLFETSQLRGLNPVHLLFVQHPVTGEKHSVASLFDQVYYQDLSANNLERTRAWLTNVANVQYSLHQFFYPPDNYPPLPGLLGLDISPGLKEGNAFSNRDHSTCSCWPYSRWLATRTDPCAGVVFNITPSLLHARLPFMNCMSISPVLGGAHIVPKRRCGVNACKIVQQKKPAKPKEKKITKSKKSEKKKDYSETAVNGEISNVMMTEKKKKKKKKKKKRKSKRPREDPKTESAFVYDENFRSCEEKIGDDGPSSHNAFKLSDDGPISHDPFGVNDDGPISHDPFGLNDDGLISHDTFVFSDDEPLYNFDNFF